MSKSGTAFNLKDINKKSTKKKVTEVFLKIVETLEEARSKEYPSGIKIEYTDIIHKTA